jgi:2-dehydro-3-deoxygluconokinase
MTGASVTTLGEPLAGLVAVETGPLSSGSTLRIFAVGAETNVAIGLSRLGIEASVIGRVGDDELGSLVVQALRSEGIDTEFVTPDPGRPTGALVRNRRGFGPSSVTYLRSRSAGAAVDVKDVTRARSVIAASDWLHLTGVTTALSRSAHDAVLAAVRLAEKAGTRISFDVNYRSRLWTVEEAQKALPSVISRCALVFVGHDEGATLTGEEEPEEIARRLSELGARAVVVKLGSEGAMHRGEQGAITVRPALSVPVPTDIVGAGDAFVAGYLAAELSAHPVPVCLDWGCVTAAFAISALGDAEGLPARSEVEACLAGVDGAFTWR